MKKLALTICAAMGIAAAASADGYVRVARQLPSAAAGTNAVVAVKLGGKAVQPLAFDLFGGTASSGTVTAYQIRNVAGGPVTNVVKATASCAATNAVSVADYRGYLYAGEPLYFKFSEAAGGTLVVYGQTKE